MRYQQAEALVGQLFGSILLRDADKEGFDHLVEKLYRGFSVADLAKELFCSEEFARNFVVRSPLVVVVKQLTMAICGWNESDQAAETAAARLIKIGMHKFVEELFEKRRQYFTKDSVPSMREVVAANELHG